MDNSITFKGMNSKSKDSSVNEIDNDLSDFISLIKAQDC
jgi:hypothetical protein